MLLLLWLQLKALLHGHSYSAHALGCAAASKSINWFKDHRTNHNLKTEGSMLREVCILVVLLVADMFSLCYICVRWFLTRHYECNEK